MDPSSTPSRGVADALRALREVSVVPASEGARWRELLNHDVEDVLSAYMTLHDTSFARSGRTGRTGQLVAAVAEATDASVVFASLARVLDGRAAGAGIARVVLADSLSRIPAQYRFGSADLFGRDVYDAIFSWVPRAAGVDPSYGQYLATRLDERAGEFGLSGDELSFARAVAPDWVGTLAGLVDVARTLARR